MYLEIFLSASSVHPLEQVILTSGFKTDLYGPGSILVAHSDHEHLRASDLLAAVDGYKRIVMSALK